jgi:CO/xanthine dehydrogenase FAD-binding subunit
VNRYDYHKPASLHEAIALKSSLPDAHFIAGGTDVMVLLRHRKLAPRNLISLRGIKELCYIDGSKGLSLGSCATHSMIEMDPFIARQYSALYDATTRLGSRQIRNVATIGGNICTAAPSADTACPLLVLDAAVMIAAQGGEREIPIDDFFEGPNRVALGREELVIGFRMPAFGENTGSAYFKHSRRQAMDLPILGVAARVTIRIDGSDIRCKDAFCTIDDISNILKNLENEELVVEDARIALGVVAPRPIRAKKAESALKGKVVSEALFNEIGEIAAGESQPRDSIRGEAWYRRDMVRVLTKRALLKSIDRVIRPDDTVYPDRLW